MSRAGLTREVISKLSKDFEQNGYAVIESFLSTDEVTKLRDESSRLIREANKEKHLDAKHVFGNENNARSDYFVTSGDKIRSFFEKQAVDLSGQKLLVPEDQSLAKIGHALHCLNPTFKTVTTSPKVQDVFKAIGFGAPTVAQSMVIFKNPFVGGEYTPHQDASFLCVEPLEKALAGIWLALDDATEENGCLEFIPGSQHWPLARRFVRVKDESDPEKLLQWTAPPKEFEASQFVKVPVKRGAMVLIDGLVVHRSGANKSEKARWIYTFHAYDKSKARYMPDNWLQMIDNETFTTLYNC